MKVKMNAEHNSLEIDFEGVKPSEEVRKVMKAYGFWWFGKGKVWCHSLEVDGEFFKDFVETRIKPLVKTPSLDVESAVAAMSEEERQELFARFLGKE